MQKIIIDADTANEIDDLFAIVRALFSDKLKVLGLTSAHFRAHDNAPPDSVAASHRINEDLLKLCQRSDVPCMCGSNNWMGKAWGGEEPADSDAVQHMIKTARAMPDGERLMLVAQGAQTSIASAIKLAPDITPKISVQVMGFRCDTETKIWNKNDFNIRNDLNAADFLLNCEGLDLTIMPADTCWHLQFNRKAAFARLDQAKPLHKYLYNQWVSHDPAGERRVMWDLALISAIIHPQMATSETVDGPIENGSRPVQVYTRIDADAMYQDFWDTLAANT